jgi:hypothetical protein
MYIALTGDLSSGFIVCGPFADAEAIDDASVEEAFFGPGGCSGYWSVSLNEPSDPNGTVVVFAGDITRDWHDQFTGPFTRRPRRSTETMSCPWASSSSSSPCP